MMASDTFYPELKDSQQFLKLCIECDPLYYGACPKPWMGATAGGHFTKLSTYYPCRHWLSQRETGNGERDNGKTGKR